MIRVAICEDEQVEREYITSLVRKQAESMRLAIDIHTFVSAEQFQMEEDNFNYDIYLLDIQMGEMNGMDFARQLRKEKCNGRIVFLTGVKDYALEGYEVGAVRYLIKPVKKEILYTVLIQIFEELQKEDCQAFCFVQGGEMVKVLYRDLVKIESRGHYVNLQTTKREYEWKASLYTYAEELEHNHCCQVRRGVYVNLAYIERINRMECILDTGERVAIGKTCYEALNQSFIQYYRMTE